MVIIIMCIFSNNAMHFFPFTQLFLTVKTLTGLGYMWNTASVLQETGTYLPFSNTWIHLQFFMVRVAHPCIFFYSGSSLSTIIIHEPDNVELLLVHFIQCYKCNWQTTFFSFIAWCLIFWQPVVTCALTEEAHESRQICQLKVHLFSFHLFVYVYSYNCFVVF